MSSAVPQDWPRRRVRLKSAIACTACRRRHLKCDAVRPVCGRCQRRRTREACIITTPLGHRSDPVDLHTLPPAENSPVQTSATPIQRSAGRINVTSPSSHNHPANPGEFSFETKTAVDARLGIPRSKKRCPIILADAPLFGPLCIPGTVEGAINPADNVLPPRRHADYLVNLYWKCLDPIEPILDQKSFWTAYKALYDGKELECNEERFMCTLNLVFALSTQLQESTNIEERNTAGRTFVLRAWYLLRPGTVLWEANSLEVVQCLLLLTKYLQCTQNLQHTWMAVGSAVRAALNLGLQNTGAYECSSSRQMEVMRNVWHQCVLTERCLSWSLGRPSTVPTMSYRLLHGGIQCIPMDAYAKPFTRMCQELVDISGYIGLSAILPGSRGLPAFSQKFAQAESDVTTHTDESLTDLESRLLSMSVNIETGSDQDLSVRQVIILRLRISYLRIMLHRHFMARLCFPSFPNEEIQPPRSRDPIAETCATICIENAQKLISIIRDDSQTEISVLIPWWYRVFYLYIAMQNLVTAMLRPEIFASLVRPLWNTAESVLGAHSRYSLSVAKCLNSFQMMWRKVNDIQCPPVDETLPPLTDVNTMSLQDVYQHLGLDLDFQVFDLHGSSLLGNADWTLEPM